MDCFDANVHTWGNVIHPEDYTRVMQHFESYITGNIDFYKIKYRCRKGDGTYLWIEDSGKIVERDENGKFTRMIGAHTDINEIELANQKLLLQNKLLQSDKATLEVNIEKAVEDIRKKDQQLINQSRHAAMGEMIGMIAHQWRQPISVISMDANNMLIDIALDNFDVSASEIYAQSIIKHTQHLSSTIDDFRNFFKPDKESSKVNIRDILDQTLSIVQDSLRNNNIELKSTFETDKKVDAYPRELMQVFVNIITNSKDALVSKRKEDALITVRVYEYKNYINTEICDNGGGIDSDILPKVFDPYFSTKDEKTGTGLGLYMSKMIIEKHLNGIIDASNNEDGASFTVKLLKKSELR